MVGYPALPGNPWDLYNGKFTDGNPVAGILASVDSADIDNAIYDELTNLVTQAGLVPNWEDSTQVYQAVLAMIAGAVPNVTTDRKWLTPVTFAPGVADDDVVYYDTVNARFDKAIIGGPRAVGVADATNNAVTLDGKHTTGNPTFLVGLTYLSPDTAGTVTTDATATKVGFAMSTTEILVDIDAAATNSVVTSVAPYLNNVGPATEGNATLAAGEISGGVWSYGDLTIPAGVTVTVNPDLGLLVLRCDGTLTIEGTLKYSGRHGSEGGNRRATATTNCGGSGGGGGQGSSGYATQGVGSIQVQGGIGFESGQAGTPGGTPGAQAQDMGLGYLPSAECSSHGNGGSGSNAGVGGESGGLVVLIARHLVLSGTVDVRGGDGQDGGTNGGGGGGGGGGVIVLSSVTSNVTGTLLTTGGAAGAAGSGAHAGTPGGLGWTFTNVIE